MAGHPTDMDNVPLIAKRKVLSNGELALPYYTGFYARMKSKISDSLHAYYSPNWEDIRGFASRYGVDALVVNRDRLKEITVGRPIFYEPFNTEMREWIGSNRDFALADGPAPLRCFENGRYVVLCLSQEGRSREPLGR